VGLDEDNKKDMVLQIAQFTMFVVTKCDRINAK
jgi:hypothetical protein